MPLRTDPRVNLVAKATILDAAEMARIVRRMAGEIVEAHRGVDGLMLIGIRTRGVPLAEGIADEIERAEGKRPPIGILDTMIAAHALQLGLTLVTHNQKHFRRVRGLEVVDWV